MLKRRKRFSTIFFAMFSSVPLSEEKHECLKVEKIMLLAWKIPENTLKVVLRHRW